MITEEQRVARRKHIGSSDVPAILGLCPWGTPLSVYASKVGESAEEEESEAAAIGNAAEDVLLNWVERRIGRAVERNLQTLIDPNGIFAVNLDGRIDEGTIVEAKSTGITDEWGEPGTDEVPERVLAQATFQMHVARAHLCHVPTLLLDGRRPRVNLYTIGYDRELGEAIGMKCMAFWERHVVPRVPPPPSFNVGADLEAFKRLRRVESCVEVAGADELFDRFEAAKQAAKDADAAVDAAKAEMLAAIGEHGGIRSPSGRSYTYASQSRRGVDVDALRTNHPDVYAAVEKVSSFRVLRKKRGSK